MALGKKSKSASGLPSNEHVENQRDSLEDNHPSEHGLGLKSSGKNPSKRKNKAG